MPYRFPPPIHPEGWRFIPVFAVVALALFWLWQPLGWLGVALTLGCAAFFRDPERVTPPEEGAVVSPADGIVLSTDRQPTPPELEMGEEPRQRISVFMSVFDVHVNRIAAGGRVAGVTHIAGRFFNASLDKASTDNERTAIRLELADGSLIGMVQIAGLVARRIRCDLAVGQEVAAGERFGLIRFGSRVDVYLPEGYAPAVLPGQRAVAGETVVARKASPRRARSRPAGP